jgi:hypothetical protein
MEPGSGRRAADPGHDDGRALHARLLRCDPTATADLAETYLPPLVGWLRRTYPRVDDALLESLAIDLVLALGQHPERFDPDRSSLPAYLRMAARGDVKNALETEHRRAAHLAPLDNVELQSPARNSVWASSSGLTDTVAETLDDERAAAMLEHFTGRDRDIVELMWDGERRSEVFAETLGLQTWPRDERDREVKRVKDRLKKRVQRVWRKLYGDD